MRRMKNKAAAIKCRNKKKMKIKQLISQANTIEETHVQLRRTIAKLEAEKTYLVKMLMMGGMGEACASQKEDILDSDYDAIYGIFPLKEEVFTNTFNFGVNTAGFISEEGWDNSDPVQIKRR